MIQTPDAPTRSVATGQKDFPGQAYSAKNQVVTTIVAAAIAIGTVFSVGVIVDDFRLAQVEGSVRQPGISRTEIGTGLISYSRPDSIGEQVTVP